LNVLHYFSGLIDVCFLHPKMLNQSELCCFVTYVSYIVSSMENLLDMNYIIMVLP